MIKVITEKNIIKIVGHANFDNYGNDIVCASVSSIIITTVNGLKNYDKDAIQVSDNEEMIIEIKKEDKVINNFIQNMLFLIKELAKQYPKNIIVKEK